MTTLLGLEVERARSPEWASDEAAGDFVRAVLERRLTDPGEIVSRAGELGSDLTAGAGVVDRPGRRRTRPRPATGARAS